MKPQRDFVCLVGWAGEPDRFVSVPAPAPDEIEHCGRRYVRDPGKITRGGWLVYLAVGEVMP